MSPLLSRLAFGAALAVATVMLLLPAEVVAGASTQDKAGHLLTFALLAVLGRLATDRVLVLGVGLIGYGAVTELLQAVLPIGRFGDPRDLAADIAGVLIGLAGFALVTRLAPGSLRD